MNLQGSYTINAPRDLVWQKLMDSKTLASALPGCEKFEPDGSGGFDIVLKVGIGAIRGSYRGRAEISEPVPPESYRMKVEGKGPGGFLKGEGVLTLTGISEGTTIHYAGEAQVGGLIASVGQRLVEAAARQIVRQFFRSLANQLEGSSAA